MKKQLILLLLALTTVCAVAGCGDKKGNDATGNSTVESSAPATSETSESPATSETPATPTYTIRWMDENGNELTSTTVEENATPAYTYTITDTAEWDFTFQGWATSADGEVLSAIPSATENATYYAIVSKVKKVYTVTFDSNGGSEVAPQTITYGEQAVAPDRPSYEGYKFVGWSTQKDGDVLVDFTAPITGNVTYYAVWNEVLNLKTMLSALLSGYELNPLSYIPESMQMEYSANLVDADDIITDYSTAKNVADVTYGHGEQWHMVLENLQESKLFFNTLTIVESLTTTSITAFNNYFDSNPSDTARHEFASGIYNVTIDFDGEVMSYVLDYTANFPLIGEATVQIALSMVAETGEKTVRVQIGDANALTYTIAENSYEFAIKYLGGRRAMFSIERAEDESVSGKIYEFLTVKGVEIASAAEFYINEDYVSVVGNKADGMVGFTGYINELYDAKSGEMLGYEVKEELSKLVYDTLWFNLDDIAGISTVKYIPKTDNTEAKLYVNGSSKVWETKKVGGLSGKMLSRRFDIEFRTQYVYSYDATTETYTSHQVSVPMMFVQEEQLKTFVEDVDSTNDITVAISVGTADVEKIMADYDELIPVFVEHKDAITVDMIIAYIGEKKIFN